MKQLPPDVSISMEQALKRYLNMNGVRFRDHSDSYKFLDFTIELAGKKFALDVKEKRQRYQTRNWPSQIPEQHMFIVDELAVRKCLAFAPYSGILVRDNIQRQYVLYPVVDLAIMPRTRLNRSIAKSQLATKGKWIIDLRNGFQADTLGEAINQVSEYIARVPTIFSETLECYGDYIDEKIGQGGIIRRPGHWNTDVSSTR